MVVSSSENAKQIEVEKASGIYELRTAARAAVEANDWVTAAQKFEAILAIDASVADAIEGLKIAHQHLGQTEETPNGDNRPAESSLSVRQLRMYIHVRRAVARLLRRPPPDAQA